MKSLCNLLCTAAIISAIALAGCKDAEYSVTDNSVYIADAATGKVLNVKMEENGADVNIVVRLAKVSGTDVTVSAAIDNRLLDEYNDKSSAAYIPVPAEYISFPSGAEATIKAGEINTIIKANVEKFDTKGKPYALPVTVSNVSGNVARASSQSSLIYTVVKPLVTSVPVMKGYPDQSVAIRGDEQDWNILTKEWTIEAWIHMNGYTRNNQAIFSNWGGGDGFTEVYIRFGDANSPYNYLQIKTLGGQLETDRSLVANTWYHWAFVYNGTTLSIYRNGKLDVRFNPPASGRPDGMVQFQTLKMISSGTYFTNQCSMCQLRFWKVARTESQIANNMYYEIDPSSPDLIGYWPMNEGEGNTFEDISGNGNHAIAGPNILQRWDHNIRFDK